MAQSQAGCSGRPCLQTLRFWLVGCWAGPSNLVHLEGSDCREMFNRWSQRHLTHVLLIDTEAAATMRTLAANAADLYRKFCEIASSPRYPDYTLALVFPKTRGDLATVAVELQSTMERLGVDCRVRAVADDEMFLVKGKAGLLACSLYLIAGAILLNDKPIALSQADSVLSLANSSGVHFVDANAGVIAHQSSINMAMRQLPKGHSVRDLLRCAATNPCV
jgi:hypothetical protein